MAEYPIDIPPNAPFVPRDQDGMDEWDFSVFDENNPSEEIGFSRQVTFEQAQLHMKAAVTMWPDRQLRMVLSQIR